MEGHGGGGGADHVDKVVSVSGDGGVMFVE